MISILIPVFNFDVRPLVTDLRRQCNEVGLPFEILCFDDGSEAVFQEKNKKIAALEGVIYKEMPRNSGRSAIRNTLGNAAKYEYLLFMDCDSKVVKADYLRSYLQQITPDALLYGGRCYGTQKPADQAFMLHWKYGMHREQTTAGQRRANPWGSFMTNNFLVPTSIFLENGFDESLRQYGHEDTLFGLQLAAKNIRIIHLDNPLEHIGLERTEHFLKKTEQGVQNLHTLWRRGAPVDTKLLRWFEKMKRHGLVGALARVFVFSKKWMWKYLRSADPNLHVFDFYKLAYLCFLENKNNNLP